MAVYSKILELNSGVARTIDLSTNTLSIQGLQINAATGGGSLTQAAHATTTTYSIVWPAAQAAGSNYVLANDGAGALSWIASATGSVTAVTASGALSSSGGSTPNITLNSNGVTNAFLAQMGANTIKGNNTGSTANALDLSTAQVTAMLNQFSSSLQGLVPASGGGTTNFLRADGTWAVAGTGTVTSVAFADASTTPIYTITGSPVTSSGTLTQTLATQTAATVFAGPATGSAAQPAFRTLVATDIPSLSAIYLPLAGGTMTGSINMGSNSITSLTTPVNPNDAVNKAYVDNFINATSWKTAALVATTANITLSGEQTIDGVLTSASRVLVKNQSTAANNGIYISSASAWSRATDMSTWAEVPAAAIFVESGTVNADLGWVCTSQPGGTLGTTAINFVQFSSAGAYTADNVTLQLVSGVFSVKNLGIGTAQLAATSVTAAKLGTVTDGVTLDQSGAGSTLEVKAAGVSATQLATGAFDQVTITGGAGTPASVANSPSVKFTATAGQTFTANTSYCVRWGLTANSETANRIYQADITTSSFDLFLVIGLVSSSTTVNAGGTITVTRLGSFPLSSADTAFASSTDGAAVFLTANGTFSVTAPSSSGQAITRVGVVQQRSATVTSNIIDVAPQTIGVN
jgi:hypothetical protein